MDTSQNSSRRVDINSYIGKRFGKLVVVSYDEEKSRAFNETHRGKDVRHYFTCHCDCGNTCTISHKRLNAGTVSCGCYRDEKLSKIRRSNPDLNVTHGLSKTRIYRIWCHMKSRCYLPTNDDYYKYGGRGIRICDEWKEDFFAFYTWAMSHGYRNDLSIDRIDNNGNYEPGNCRWTTMMIQTRNTRKNVYITYTAKSESEGDDFHLFTFIIHDWAKILQCSYQVISKYLFSERGDMSVNEVLELCNRIGHGGKDEPIIIPDELMRYEASDHLDESIQDSIEDPQVKSLTSEHLNNKVIRKFDIASLIGKKFGWLTITGYDHSDRGADGKQRLKHFVKCKCDCGNENVVVRYDLLKCGSVYRCERHRYEERRKSKPVKEAKKPAHAIIHGGRHTKLYKVWQAMKNRCYNRKDSRFKNYGARGITVCPEWKNDFIAFRSWAESCNYSDDLILNLVEGTNEYNAQNCEWITREEYNQLKGKKNLIYITYTNDYRSIGKGYVFWTFTIADWSTILNVHPKTLSKHIREFRDSMTVNGILELCNNIGHGGSGDHPIVIPDNMFDHMETSHLKDSIRDSLGVDLLDNNESSSKKIHRKFNPDAVIGERYGRLTTVGYDRKDGKYHYVKCKCDCGNPEVLKRSFRYDMLRSGYTKSCGCLNTELRRERAYRLNSR